MYPIFRLINSYDFPCFNRIRLEISLQFRKKVEHTLLQTKLLFDDNLWALSIHPTTNKAHCFNQFIAPSALLLKKIHWTCKWIILIEWRLLKKYVTCLHRDAVRKTDVHSFFFSFSFWLYTCGILKPGCTNAPNQYYILCQTRWATTENPHCQREVLCAKPWSNTTKKTPGILERYQKHTSIVSCLSKGIPGTVVLRLNSP